MSAGTLRDRVILQEPAESYNADGESAMAWSQFAQPWAEVAPEAGSEDYDVATPRVKRRATTRIRYRAGVTERMRMLVPEGGSTLDGAIDAGATAVEVASAAPFPGVGSFRVRIGDELLEVTSGAGTTSWTVTRGVDGTTAASHADGTGVRFMEIHDIEDVADRDRRRKDLYLKTAVQRAGGAADVAA